MIVFVLPPAQLKDCRHGWLACLLVYDGFKQFPLNLIWIFFFQAPKEWFIINIFLLFILCQNLDERYFITNTLGDDKAFFIKLLSLTILIKSEFEAWINFFLIYYFWASGSPENIQFTLSCILCCFIVLGLPFCSSGFVAAEWCTAKWISLNEWLGSNTQPVPFFVQG